MVLKNANNLKANVRIIDNTGALCMLKKLKSANFQKVRVANAISVGGMIGAGKTTLSGALGKALNANVVYELSENDELQDALLKRLYKGDEVSAAAFQIYFFCMRFNKYKENIKNSNLSIFDRTIFEDRLFAHQNMTADPIMFGYYDAMWHEKTKELVYSVGVPKLYIILDLKWKEFKDKIFKRGRACEIDNFSENESYFKSLQSVYVKYLRKTCQIYGINHIVVDSEIPTDKQVKKIIEKIKDEKLIEGV